MKHSLLTLCLFFSIAMVGQEVNPNKYPIKVGEQVEILTNTFEFLEVTMDSRCPKDVSCVMAGWAMVDIKITQQGEASYVKSVKIPAEIPSKANPKLLCLESGECVYAGLLTPYPVSTQTMEDRAYRLELWVLND